MITLVVVTDSRADYLARTIESADENLCGPITHRAIVDDSGDPDYAKWLRENYPSFHLVRHPERRGLAAAVGSAWAWAASTDARFLFHLEDDFTFNEKIPLDLMGMQLDAHPHLAQFVLKRQPWSPEEKEAGGQIEVAPDEYSDRLYWVEHRRLFSFNPSLIPRWVFAQEWGPVLERDVSDRLFEDSKVVSAYWGRRTDPPRCHHIGEARSAGYRW